MKLFLSEKVFRHEALDTTTLDYLLDKKNAMCRMNVWSYGVYPADELPDVFFSHDNYYFNWISNTDIGSMPGTHWVSVTVKKKIIAEMRESSQECEEITVCIMDSWGKNSETNCKAITDNLIDAYNVCLSTHKKEMDEKKLKCKCELKINFPVTYRIQYSSYENCGWFALYFSCLNDVELKSWIDSVMNGYGQITNNYENIISFFKNDFFPNISEPCDCNFDQYKKYIRNRQHKKKIQDQCCCNYNSG